MDSLNQVKTNIKVKLIPRSSKNQIIGREGDAYKVKLMAPPVDGKANKTLIDLLAKRLRRPKESIEIIAGKSSRLKSIRVYGLSPDDVAYLLKM